MESKHILPHLCQARDEYYRVEGLLAFNVRGAIAKRRNGSSVTYLFQDGSRLVVLARGAIEYKGQDGRPYAIRATFSYDGLPQKDVSL